MNRLSAPRYDLFKLIVTIVLVVILLLMLLRGCATIPASLSAENTAVSEPTQSGGPLPETEMPPSTDTAEVASPATVLSATPTVPATNTPAPEAATPTPVPVTIDPDSTVTEPTATVVEPTASTADSSSCNTSVPSRLAVGQKARVMQRLNMRSDALITAPIMQTNATGTQVDIIGGPVCTPVGDRAYLWWQIRLSGGAEGWSAESTLNEATYLLEPIP